ncbi:MULTISPECIES: envelope stress response membrane protein PspC [Sphingomonas]|uniref:envelope stress response membrane protein PspC n=1 Tax=Sphingomonas TaxID=13687 RepID=UPI000DEEE1E1|nr:MULTISPECIES: envelope stress response membrane protein PspC [Sphingomonas]
MASQPPLRTKFYKNKRDGKVMGVCAGIADYTGLDVTVVRIGMFLALWLSGFSILPVYFIAGWIADDTPREVALESADERRFWQGVRQSPARTARDIHARFREIDRRLADVESYTLSNNRSLANEIERLR